MRKMIIGAFFGALLFVGSMFHIRTMDVVYVYHEHASLIDCDGEVFAIDADGLKKDDFLYCFCFGSGKNTVIFDYVKGE